MQLTEKVCLVTGGTSGIGAAVCHDLLANGAYVIAVGRTERTAELERLNKSAADRQGRFLFIAGDAGTQAGCERIVRTALDEFGKVDVLVHSAGGAVLGSTLTVSVDDWTSAFAVHVHAIFHLVRAVAPSMQQNREGSIVLISSAAGQRGIVGADAYGVAKGALPQFARILARELADSNIRVNCISPGVIRTPFQDYLTPAQVENNIKNRIPLHREGTMEDVAAAITMLVRNDYITGADLVIDGGLTMRIA
ncbi:MAG TPA: SDR family oxidoreductase [Bryobacteraceae bacterium]|nr:SDR family oxidoreductase [Bryobacteraceae bacterium]